MTQLDMSVPVALPLPKRHKWVVIAMVSHPTSQVSKAIVPKPEGGAGRPFSTHPSIQGGSTTGWNGAFVNQCGQYQVSLLLSCCGMSRGTFNLLSGYMLSHVPGLSGYKMILSIMSLHLS